MSVFIETKMATTPLPLPAHFSQAEQSFSLKKRRLPFSSSSTSTSSLSPPAHLSHSLPPRPPSKGCPPLSRVFPRRPPSPWTPLSGSLIQSPPPPVLYDPSKQQSYFSQCFTNLGLLGQGSFGEVYKVLSHQDGRHYAVKRSVQRFRGNGERNRSIREARSHERLGPHPHILGFVAAWEEGGRLYIQTELCCTSLLMHAEAQPPSPDEPAAWAYLCDLLSALHHLHSQGFAHLDLKPANVFLTRSGRLKLGDFGLLLEPPAPGPAEGRGREDLQEGDPRYMAPELLRGEYGPAADVFSLGVSILELACSVEVPQGGEGWQQLRRGCLPSEFTNSLSGELQAVLRMMLCPEPGSRASVAQLLGLPCVRRRRWRRRGALLLRETLLTLVSFCQMVVCSGWRLLSLLAQPLARPLARPLAPAGSAPAPRTPERSSLQEELTLPPSPTHTHPGSLQDSLDPELSPSFSHRVKSRLSVGSTSTPLPATPLRAYLRPACTPPRSCPLHTPSHSLTHSPPSSILSSRSGHTLTPSLSPIDLGPQAPRLTEGSVDPPSLLSASTTSCHRPARNWVTAEPLPRPSFEPKNLLSLFDDTTLEGQP